MTNLVCFFATCIITVNCLSGDYTTIDTKNGKIVGQENETENLKLPFWTFLGIPYAAPPIGNLRFKSPQPAKPWTEVRNASYYRSVCTQGSVIIEGSEDCLFANIFTSTKPGSFQNSSLPVMVYIHGGSFTFGNGNVKLESVHQIMEYGVIFVTINYRLGIFGFLCTKDASSPGNYGLKDQIAALKWIKENIATFGGDPNKVTLFGQSAGAIAVQYLLQAKSTKGLYRGVIANSGSSLMTWAIPEDPRRLAFKVGQTNLIITKKTKTLVNRLRKINNKLLQITSTELPAFYNGLPWAPCIENDVEDAVVTSFSYEQQRYGDFVRVPILTGINSNEAREVPNYAMVLKNLLLTLQPDTLVPNDMNCVDVAKTSSLINKFYFDSKIIKNNMTALIHYSSDYLFVRGLLKSAQLLSKYVPLYLYKCSFIGGVDHKSFNPEGVAHTEELLLMYNPQVTDAAKLAQKRMIKMWTNFVKTGNPTPVQDEILNIKWPLYNATGNGNASYLNIDTNLTLGVNPENDGIVFWNNLYDTYGFEPFNTY